jgi:methylated-DNA-[protein]-cysteine S-methyltransferase
METFSGGGAVAKEYSAYYNSQIGVIEITSSEKGILSLDFADKAGGNTELPECLNDCLLQLDEYFKGKRKEFSVEILPSGTDFQMKVWEKLREIPYGKTASYADIAEAAGNRKAVRAVGGANNKNKIAIIIPCHRVIGSNGSLTGYAGELWRKEWLLNHEKNYGG